MSRRVFLTLIVLVPTLCAAGQVRPVVLFDFAGDFDIGSVGTSDAEVTLLRSGSLRIETGHEKQWPGITLKAPSGKWDLSKYEYVSADVKNSGTEDVTIYCRLDNPGTDGRKNCVTGNTKLGPGQAGVLTTRFLPTPWRLSEPLELIGMRGAPTYLDNVDPTNITQLLVFVNNPRAEHAFEISKIRAGGEVEVLDAKTFLPFIDEFGQFIHKDWPGKTHSQQELIDCGKAEERDLAAYPGPVDRNKYGGWTAGPELEATGFFRVQKHRRKWWLVDPEGRLFWSHGIDCVRSSNATPISDREHYYASLPESGSSFEQFYGRGTWAPHGYYADHSPYKTYDFSRANFLRKYGPGWEIALAEITHRRLKSWGMNTIANWSQDSIYLMRRTPYVCTLSYDAKRLEGSTGYWGKFYDVFDPSFRQALRKRLAAEEGKAIGDPWCVGYFVDNELAWGDDTSLALAVLASPAKQPAKKVFLADLKKKYGAVEKLNLAWETEHSTWEELLRSQKAPDKGKARTDLTAFYTKTAETYFGIIRDELKAKAPNQLYMGCRFAWVNDLAARAGAKFCDIVSYNRYSYSVAEHRLPDGIDMPTIIGEFHFGALDRGMFHTGLKKTADQTDRADKYASYVRGALRNPQIVGTHWFQYKDQATTGRGDGENYQIGFIDICDKPYPEIVEASREVGYGLYEYRLKSK